MKPEFNLIGQKFGRLSVKNQAAFGVPYAKIQWDCICDCGNTATRSTHSLKWGCVKIPSCGCHHRELIVRANLTHGGTGTKEHKTWNKMRDRCSNPNCERYPHYGGRGIRVCDRWLGENGFENFLKDMGCKPSSKHSIDRINNDGNYEPSNCRWATREEQHNNTKRTRRIEFNGRTQTLSQWSKEIGVSVSALFSRLQKGWTLEKALSPRNHKATVSSQADD